MNNKLIDTFKQTADRIAFLDRGYGVGKPDVQSAIEDAHLNNISVNRIRKFGGLRSIGTNKFTSMSHKKPKPMIVLTFDDGTSADYETVFPIVKEYGVPFHSVIIATNLTENKRVERNSKGGVNYGSFLTQKQIEEMLKSGLLNVSSHGFRHLNLGRNNVSDVSAGSKIIYLSYSSQRFTTQIGDKKYKYPAFIVGDNGQGEREDIVIINDGWDSEQRYFIETEKPLAKSHSQAYLSLSEEAIEEEIVTAIEIIQREVGQTPYEFFYPNSSNSPEARKIVSQYHTTGVAVGRRYNPANEILRTYSLYRHDVIDGVDITLNDIDKTLDETINKNSLSVYMAHPWMKDSQNPDFVNPNWERNLRYLIEGANNRGIPIVTMETALQHFSNPVEIGDFIGGLGGDSPESFFVKTREGLIVTNNIVYTSPDGSMWRMSVNDEGEPTTEKIN